MKVTIKQSKYIQGHIKVAKIFIYKARNYLKKRDEEEGLSEEDKKELKRIANRNLSRAERLLTTAQACIEGAPYDFPL